LACLGADLHLSVQPFTELVGGDIEVVVRLQPDQNCDEEPK
jgi:hypothetical protein